MAETAQERTEEATPKRRQDARRKGTVAKSVDLNGAVVLMALLVATPYVIGRLSSSFGQSLTLGFRNMPGEMNLQALGGYTWTLLEPCLTPFGMLLAVALVTGVMCNFAQVGFVLSAETLNPNLNKINPINGLKRLFSLSSQVEGLKATVKCFLFMYLAWTSVQSHWPDLVGLAWKHPLYAVSSVGMLVHSIFLRVGIAWLALALLDYLYQRKRVSKELRMTKEELKQEMKESEQSPELKGAMARRRRKLAKGRMMDAVRKADVIVTNPTHFAVAIQYEHGKMPSPIVVAKGADYLALKIREVGAQHRVPIVPNPPLARALYKQCEVGDAVPRELFQPVAEVLAYVYSTLRKIRKE
ncbi:MAG TPA: flagellar biosynthesis protein FlhB [Fimbriimonadaceae bacterium]|nr:flagellar biosynthesis protein FlhB [Fimbriimonadaceae bacterium]